MGNGLQSLETLYLFLTTNLSALLATCQNQDQRAAITSLYKKFALGERMHIRIGVSAYNLPNHPNFAAPGHDIARPGFGLITGTVTPPTSAHGAFQGSAVSGRVMVLTGKFVF